MRTGCILFACGVACVLYSHELLPTPLVCLIPLGIILGLRFPPVRLPVYLLCGLLWASFRADMILRAPFPASLEGKTLTIEGVISSLPVEKSRGQSFTLDLKKLKDEKGIAYPFTGKIRLNWYQAATELVPGDYWRLQVRLKRPHGFMNPGGFDYEAWLFQQRIKASGYVREKSQNTLVQQEGVFNLHRLRYHMRERLRAVIVMEESASLIPALVLGDRSAIVSERWRVLTSTGTSHLLAISGLHIGLIAGIVFFLTRWLWPLGGITALLVASPKAASVAAIVAALCYALMAGFSVPTQRALIMLMLVLLAKLMAHHVKPSEIIAFAFLLILILDPFALLSAGFWLSFSAIVVIAYGMLARVGNAGFWWRWGRVQYLVAVGLTPLLALLFQQIPLTSIAANILVVPWVSFVTVPLVLLGSLLLWLEQDAARFLLQRGIKSIDLFWPVLEKLASLQFSVFSFSEATLPALLAAIAGVLMLLMPTGLGPRWPGLICLLPLFFPVQDRPEHGQARFTLLDVGQGLSAVLQTRRHVMIFDAGPRYSSNFEAGSAVILPYLRRKGLKQVDLLVQSHGDIDHIGGLQTLLASVPVIKILTSVADQIQHDAVQDCKQGQFWNWDGVDFEILHPGINSKFRGNDRSCVIKVSASGETVLLTGDIEAKAEYRILGRDRSKLASTVLLAPHHGSRSSSSPEFISAVAPAYVLFPVGYRNRFGFPKQDIIERYQKRGVTIMDSARHGAIEMLIGAGDLQIRAYRNHARRFWHRTN